MVTAGPTHEDFDPVRFLTNRSSGKQGYALAQVAWRRGAEATLVSGPSGLSAPYGVERSWCAPPGKCWPRSRSGFPRPRSCSWRRRWAITGPPRPKSGRSSGAGEMAFHLTQNPDILKEVAPIKSRQIVVGFAAETHDMEAEARRKMKEKHLDLIVANDVNRPDSGFQVDTNEVTLILGRRARAPAAVEQKGGGGEDPGPGGGAPGNRGPGAGERWLKTR